MLNQHDPSRTTLCRPHGSCPTLKRLRFGSPRSATRSRLINVRRPFGPALSPLKAQLFLQRCSSYSILLSRFAEHDKPASHEQPAEAGTRKIERMTPLGARGDGIYGWL